MAETKSTSLVTATLTLLLAGSAAVVTQQTLAQKPAAPATPTTSAAAAAAADAAKVATAAKTNASKVLVFRNRPSWNRNPDFEDVLLTTGLEHDVKNASEMGNLDPAKYPVVIIPGAQGRTDFYQQYSANADRFDRYVTNGGILVLELNGAEDDGILLPRGVSMVGNGARENTILTPGHPILIPMGGKTIRASFASHGYLDNVPPDALVLVTETIDGKGDTNRPTFIEYPHGKGRVLAACQCFHDRDGSGRGVMMETVIAYATEKKWYQRPKAGENK